MAKTTKNEKHADLTKIEGTTAYVMNNNTDLINTLYYSSDVNVEENKNILVSLLRSEAKDIDSREKVINKILKQSTKERLLFYIYNSLLSGANLASIDNTNVA